VTNNDVVARAMFMAYHYYRFSVKEMYPDKTTLMGAMLGLLFNTIDHNRILPYNNELTVYCTNAGLRPV
jgi:hypothetical protein